MLLVAYELKIKRQGQWSGIWQSKFLRLDVTLNTQDRVMFMENFKSTYFMYIQFAYIVTYILFGFSMKKSQLPSIGYMPGIFPGFRWTKQTISLPSLIFHSNEKYIWYTYGYNELNIRQSYHNCFYNFLMLYSMEDTSKNKTT